MSKAPLLTVEEAEAKARAILKKMARQTHLTDRVLDPENQAVAPLLAAIPKPVADHIRQESSRIGRKPVLAAVLQLARVHTEALPALDNLSNSTKEIAYIRAGGGWRGEQVIKENETERMSKEAFEKLADDDLRAALVKAHVAPDERSAGVLVEGVKKALFPGKAASSGRSNPG